jgi:hypothetical protein
MKIKIHYFYQFLLNRGIVKVYYANGVPFAWDDIRESEKSNPEIYLEVGELEPITIEDISRGSNYLIMECAHPLLFELEYTEDSVKIEDVCSDI